MIKQKNIDNNIDLIPSLFMGQELTLDQKTILRDSWSSAGSVIVAHEGWGKTYMAGLLALTNAWLRPGQRVGCFAPSWRQSKLIYDQIEKVVEQSPIIQTSLESYWCNNGDWGFSFKPSAGFNPSMIRSFSVSDNYKIKGARFHTVIVDEAVNLPKEVFQQVFLPMTLSSSNPFDVMRAEKEKELVSSLTYLGANRKDEMIKEITKNSEKIDAHNQMIMFTTAGYKPHWLHSLYKDWETKDNRFVTTIPCSLTPFSIVCKNDNGKSIPKEQFEIEYECQWAECPSQSGWQ